jgi:sporulation protein YqfC
MKQKRRMGQRLQRAMELPDGLLTNATFMEIEGDSRVVITGCKGIHTYSEECICLCTARGAVSFYGRDLEMGCLSADGATVSGRLQRIEFDGGGDA